MNFSTMTPRVRMIIRCWLYVAVNVVLIAVSLYQAFTLLHSFQTGTAAPLTLGYLVFYVGFALMLLVFSIKTTKKTVADLKYFNVTDQFQEWMDNNENKGERP